MRKVLNNYITAFDDADKIMLVLPSARGISICSFIIVICAPVGVASASIASTSISLVFLVGNGNLKTFLKAMEKKKKHTKIVSFIRCKLYSIEKIISKGTNRG